MNAGIAKKKNPAILGSAVSNVSDSKVNEKRR